jgi:acetylglutamate kinase
VKLLIKLGGTLLDDASSRERLACEIAAVSREHQVAVVHGGGKQMTRFLTERGVESRFVNGLRVTTPEVLDAVLKIFAGSVNSQLVSAFRKAGALPVGLSGLDAGLVDAEPLDPQLGAVGRPVRSDARLLNVLVESGYLPVVACVAGDSQGRAYNVNGDQMAAACAISFHADRLIFLTDVDGVREGDRLLSELRADQARTLIQNGIATGGMQAKLEAALSVLENSKTEISIAPGAKAGIVHGIIASESVGTRLTY